MNDTLSQRQRWFRSFPEGTLEFLLVTRILSVFLLLSLTVVRESQRTVVLLALSAILLLDYVLMVWWAVQMTVDLNSLVGRTAGPSNAGQHEGADQPGNGGAGPGKRGPRGSVIALLACLPALTVFLALAPWPELFIRNPFARADFMRVFLPAAGVLFLVSLVIGYRALAAIRPGPSLWTALVLVPFLHWFAMHRLVAHMRTRLDAYSRSRGEVSTDGMMPAIPIADVTWALAVVPWAAVAVLRLVKGTWSSYFPPCGAVLVAIFAVADVGVMEGLQKRFLVALRRLELPPRQ